MGLFVSLIGNDDRHSLLYVEEVIAQAASLIPVDKLRIGSNVKQVAGQPVGTAQDLHSLRAFALYWEKRGRAPTEEERAQQYPLLQDLYDAKERTERFQHLIDHSDSDGYYLPLDFANPVTILTDVEGFLSIGSSLRLLGELEELIQPLWRGAKQAAPEIEWAVDEKDPWMQEKLVWRNLTWLCRNSKDYNLVVRFC